MEPQVMMKLHLDSPPEVCVKKLNRTEDCSADEEVEQILEPLRNNDVMLQTDPSNLVHMCSVLEDALNQIKTSHVRRHIKNLWFFGNSMTDGATSSISLTHPLPVTKKGADSLPLLFTNWLNYSISPLQGVDKRF